MYLQPIFDSPDIMKQLPKEGKMFKGVDHKWRLQLGKVHTNNSLALAICSTDGLLETWQNANNDLELGVTQLCFATFCSVSRNPLGAVDTVSLIPYPKTNDPSMHQFNFLNCVSAAVL